MVTIRQRKLILLPCEKQECQITPWNLKKDIWLAVYSRSNLIGVTYIHPSLTHSLTHWPIHNIPDAPTKRYFFTKKITQWLRNLFFARLGVLNWRHNRSQSPVFGVGFGTPPEVKFDAFGTSKHGEGKSLSKKNFATLISALERFNRANKKNLSYAL